MRLYNLTRDKSFLRRGCAYIILAAIAICWGIRLLQPTSTFESLTPQRPSELSQLRQAHHQLETNLTPSPHLLTDWLRQAAALHQKTNLPVVETETFPSENNTTNLPTITHIFHCPIPPLLQQHTRNPQEKNIFTHYLNARFHPETIIQHHAYQQLLQITLSKPTPRYAHELLGDLQFLLQENRNALNSYLQEASQPDAQSARSLALRLAFQLEDDSAIAQLIAIPSFLQQETDHHRLRQIAHTLKDHTLLAKAHWQLIINHWSQPLQVSIALIALLIWSTILFCTGNRQKRILWLCTFAILSGILSAWLTRWSLDAFQYGSKSSTLNSPDSLRHLLHCILYIGIPEEAAKLLLLIPFLPYILSKHHSPTDSASTTALLGGFVGLGFALEENLQYFIDESEAVALGRLLTANVIHLSLTGYIAWHFHHLIHSRFHHAANFISAFALIAIAHGLYDYLLIDPHDWGTQLFAFIILALVARQYLRLLPTTEPTRRRFTISRTCVFVFGATLLTSIIMILFTWRSAHIGTQTIIPILQSTIALIPVALIFIHEFDEVQ